MFDATQLLSFLAAVLVLVVVPGPNTIIILAQSIGRGRAAGLATVAGIEVGTFVHTLAAALGLSALLSASALAYSIVKYAGVAYLIVIGIRTLLQPPPDISAGSIDELTGLVAFRRALLTNVLNPKVALFFLAFLPQFVRPERGNLALQILVLGLLVSAVSIPFGSLLALAATSMTRWLREHASFARWQQRITGGVLIGLGLRLAVTRAH
jgi:threonine/homoserine/homoserine lactone efflux protein